MKNLSELSPSYYLESPTYEKFSQAQDSPGLISQYLIPYIAKKHVLDVGCGNGKYFKIFNPFTQSMVGIDKSYEQLKLAGFGYESSAFIQADCTHIPIENSSYEVVLGTWFLGTIVSDEKRLSILNEMIRVLAPGGSIILVENDVGGYFEKLRGRDNNTKTQDYNQWLLDNGFKIKNKLTTYFKFDSTYLAQDVFKSIWGDNLHATISQNTIDQKIVFFEFCEAPRPKGRGF